MRRLSATVSGRVQGVSYRASTRKVATRLGLTGWVRNLANGDVELVAEGAPEQLDELVAWAHEGPIFARVDAVATTTTDATGEFTSFDIVR